MKHTTRLLALGALVLAVVLAAIGTPALNAPSVAFAQLVPVAPVLTAQRSGANTINLSWEAVDGAAYYELYAHDGNRWDQIDDGDEDPPVRLTATSFQHENLVPDQLYFYQILAVNAGGAKGALSVRINVVAGPNAPDRPVLSTTAGYQSIRVEWDAVPNAASYVLYRWDQSWAPVGGDISDNFYEHPGLNSGQTYFYQARAKSSGGVLSALSLIVEDTVLASPNISAPTSFNAARGNGEITLTWGAPSNTAGDTIARYEYRSRESGDTFPPTWTRVGTAVTATVRGLTNGTAYDFEIRAIGDSGAEGDPASTSGTPSTVSDAPTLTATAGYQRIVLNWTAPSENGGAAITSYRIERENDDGSWTSTGGRSLPGSVLTWTPTGLNNAVEYTYRIFAINIAGDSDWTSASALTLANPIAAPAAPVGIIASPGSGSVSLRWTAPVFNGGAPVTEYEYRYQKDDSNQWTSFMSNGTDLSVTITDLTPGDAYDFEVVAVNIEGRGDAAEVTSTPLPTAPTSAPVITVVLSRDGTNTDNREQIKIEWRSLPESANGGVTKFGTARTNNAVQYELEWKADDGDWMTTNLSGVTTAGDLNVRYHPESGNGGTALEPGTTYTYRLRAINSADDDTDYGESPDDDGADANQVEENGPWSTERSARTVAIAPSTPQFELVEADADGSPPSPRGWVVNSNAITIRWIAPADGGSDITSYEIEVRPVETNEDNEFTEDVDGDPVDKADNTRISNLPGNRTEYTLSGLKDTQGYFFRIRALNNADGDRSHGEHPDDANAQANQVPERSAWSVAPYPVATTRMASLGTHAAPSVTAVTETPADSGTLQVTWEAATVTGNLDPVTKFEIQWLQRDASTNTGDNPADDLAALNAAEAAGNANIVVPTPPTNTTYPHTDLPGLKRYVYRVRAINSAGASPWSDVEVNDAATTGARDPGTPMLTATAVGASEILLEWTKPDANGTDIEGYEIVQWNPDADPAAWGTADLLVDDPNTTGDDEDEDTVDTTVLTIGDLDAGVTYYFRIRASWDNQADRGWSATTTSDAASASTVSGVPGAPGLTAEPGEDVGSIKLTIAAPTSGGSDLTGYELQRYENGAWKVITAPATDDTSYTDDGLTPGVKYYYYLTASNSSGTGPSSAVVNEVATAGNPDVITTLAANATSDMTIRLTWTAPANNGKTIIGYDLQKRNTGNTAWENIAGFPDTDTVTEYIDTTGLTAGNTYHYRIRALVETFIDTDDPADGTGDEGWSAEDEADGDNPPKGSVSATTHAAVPEAVTVGGTPSATANSITITWGALAAEDTGGSDVKGYNVYKWDGSSWVLKTSLGLVLTYPDTGLAAGTKHYYIVRAENDQGLGQWSNYVSATTTAAIPDAPDLAATARDTTSIQLTWNVPDDNGTAITGFTLQRWDRNSFGTIQVVGADLELAVDTTLYVDASRDPGTEYWYRIRAIWSGQSDTQGWSAVASDTTVAAPPERIVLTRPIPVADITHNSIKLTWTEPEDNGSTIIHYEVQLWNATTHSWGRIALISATHTTYTHRNLSAETRYVYRVRAQNRAPNTDGFGSFSTIIAATTVEAPE